MIHHKSSYSAPRSGFTLVELMVAMAIFLILSALAVSAFRGNDADRITAGAATIRNALEGARSRAIKSQRPTALRLITDPLDGRLVTSVVYVQAPELFSGTCRVEYNPSLSAWTIIDQNGAWSTLISRGLMASTNRVEIPENSGNWFHLGAAVSTNTWTFTGQYQPCLWFTRSPTDPPAMVSTWMPANYDATDKSTGSTLGVSSAIASQPMSYRMELSPTVLAGAEPIAMPRNVVVDLDGSNVPSAWRPSTTGLTDQYATNMDILFDPNGTCQQMSTVIHLRVTSLEDALAEKSLGSRPLTSSATNGVLSVNPVRGQRLVSVFPMTGNVIAADVDQSTSGTNSGFNSNLASQPFSLAVQGKEFN